MSDIRIKMAKDLRDMSDMVGDLHWMAAKAVEDLTKKDGEIAKRDEELAACRVAVENCEVFRARIAELEARIVWLECEAQVNAAPVSEAKAQGVVIPPSPYMPGSQPTDFTDYELGEIHGRIAMWEEVKRLNAAHAQQESVPDGWRELAKRADDFLYSLPETDGVLRLRADLCSMLAAPVSEAKAQGVVIDADDLAQFIREIDGNHKMGAGVLAEHIAARLNATPVQQVSVPDWYVLADKKSLGMVLQALVNAPHHIRELQATRQPVELFSDNPINVLIANYESPAALIAAAPAAPAADAWIVDMYRHLQKVTPYRFKKIQDASITDGGDVMYFHKDRFDAALLADMAAHCAAKGVV